MIDNRAKRIIARVAKKQIEQKFGSVAKAITKMCGNNEQTLDEALKEKENG